MLYVAQSGAPTLALRDLDGDGHADTTQAFGPIVSSGLAIDGDRLFLHTGNVIVRYTLTGSLVPASPLDTIVTGIPTGGHATRSLAVDGSSLYVNVGSPGNTCASPVIDPCDDLTTRAGIWRFSSATLRQPFTASARFATGIRNAVGLAIRPDTRSLWATQHGRDNLQTQFPALFTGAEGIENPGEELFEVRLGDDFGWPYCYYDMRAGRRLLAPDYGGNRVQEGRCASTRAPVAAFPGHWAPNGLLFYTGTSFPDHYWRGAFIAFHGSWNRAPSAQAGYLVAFLPASGAGVTGPYEIFADGFKGASPIQDPDDAAHRPTGLAIDAAGALYVGDDWHGRIWRIVYKP